MYTLFETLFLSNEMRQKYNLCCVLFLQPLHVQNVHLLPRYTPNNDIEQSDMPSGFLLNGILLMACSKLVEHWISPYQSHENIASMSSFGIVKKLRLTQSQCPLILEPFSFFIYLFLPCFLSFFLSLVLSLSHYSLFLFLSLFLSFPLSFSLSFFLSFFLSFSLSLSFSFFLSFFLTLSFFLSLFLTLFLSFSLSFLLFLSLYFLLSFFLSLFLSYSFFLSLFILTLFLSFSLSFLLFLSLFISYSLSFFFFYVNYPPQCRSYTPGTYNPNARGSDSCKGSNKLWTRTLRRYTRAGLPECVVSTMSGPPLETTQDRTQIKDTHPVPEQKLKFLIPPGIEPRPQGRKAGTLSTIPRRRTIRDIIHLNRRFDTQVIFPENSSSVFSHKSVLCKFFIA